jgi:phosphohistidine phosphatase
VNDNPDETPVELCLIRHADAGDSETWRGDDAQRPLSDKGRRQASALGRFLSRRGYKPDAILSSPKMRSRQTAELVAAALATAVQLDERLVGTPDLGTLSKIVEDVGRRRIVLVGHDPEFSELAAELIGAQSFSLKKGTLVRIDVVLPLQPGTGVLRWMLPADLVG